MQQPKASRDFRSVQCEKYLEEMVDKVDQMRVHQ
jgi:hypothetical protein